MKNRIKTIISKKIIKPFLINLEFIKYCKNCKKNNLNKYILFGTPIHGNIGDHAITVAEVELLKDLNITPFEVSSFERGLIIKKIKKNINKNDIIFINGGGFMGNQWLAEEKMIREVVNTFSDNKVIIFPQTAFYKNDEKGQKEFEISFNIYNKHKNLFICAREKITYEFLKNTYKNATILFVPDIVLYLNEYNFNNKRDGVLFCMRSDPEKSLTDQNSLEIINIIKKHFTNIEYTDTVTLEGIKSSKRNKAFINKLEQFSKSSLVITDRLHGMIFAAITNTPCIVFSNYNHKVKGVYNWIKDLDYIYFIEDINLLDDVISNFKNKKFEDKYNDLNIKNNFNILKEAIESGKN